MEYRFVSVHNRYEYPGPRCPSPAPKLMDGGKGGCTGLACRSIQCVYICTLERGSPPLDNIYKQEAGPLCGPTMPPFYMGNPWLWCIGVRKYRGVRVGLKHPVNRRLLRPLFYWPSRRAPRASGVMGATNAG